MLTHPSSLLLLVFPLFLACGNKTAVTAEQSGPTTPTPPAFPAATDAPIVDEVTRHSGDPTPWPTDAIAGVHGWLAVRAGTTENPTPWGVFESTQPYLILNPAWSVPQKTTLQALVTGGKIPLVSHPKETVSYGCEGGYPVEGVTPLKGNSSADLLWVVSPTYGNAKGLSVSVTDAENSRIWRFGDHTLGLSRTDPYHANLWLDSKENVIRIYAQLAEFMEEEEERRPVDITGGFLIPQVVAAWQVGKKVVVGLHWDSLEGVHFNALLLNEGAASLHDLQYVYRCAY